MSRVDRSFVFIYNSSMAEISVFIEDEVKRSYLDYAMSVIVGRALPDIRDGLKPVQRRILYSMYELGLFPRSPYKKCATVVGDVLGKYHPHGDMAVYDALARMAQDFSLRMPLIDGQGNFGSIDGDSPAAYRYTEARLSPIAMELLSDLDKDTVDFLPNFDRRLREPVVLPASFPNLLVQGASGIAVGMATNIPPHNFEEVISGLCALIDNPQVSIAELMKYIKGPDFPTGGIIVGTEGIKEAYETGKGKIVIRGRVKFEEVKGGKERLVITEIPYQVNKASLIAKIAELVKEKRIEGISDLRDESDKDGMRIVIDLKRDTAKEVVLSNLYKLTPLQETYGIIFLGLIDNSPKIFNLKEYLEGFLNFRYETFVRKTKFLLQKAEEKAHILSGFKVCLANIDAVIALIKKAKDTDVARDELMKRFRLSSAQAEAILEMRLARLTRLEREKIEEEYQGLLKEINRLKSILSSRKNILAEIKKELLLLKERFPQERRTEIIPGPVEEIRLEDLIEEEDTSVIITHKGYIKRMSVSSYRKQARGGVGRSGLEVQEEDFVTGLFVATTHDYLLFFTDKGKVYYKKVYEIPEGGFASRGRNLINLLELEKEEKITSYLAVRDFKAKGYVFMVTKKGRVKKSPLSLFANPRKKGILAIKLDKDDELKDTFLTSGKDEVFLFTKKGKGIRFKESDVREMGRQASGVLGIRLEKDDSVIDGTIGRKDAKLLILTEKGYGKLVPYSSFPIRKRGGKGVIAGKVSEKAGFLLRALGVKDEDDIILITKMGQVMRMKVSEVKAGSRQALGVRLITLRKGDSLTDCARVAKEEE